MVSIDDYNEVKDCIYKDEHYSARDNGAIMRHQREGMRKRKLDGVWSFGTPNAATGYMDFCGERVHRIVATAFHGQAPSEQHVVDHIDTNRHNNRPNNLRWLTKLENILINEITRRKVELICGSVEAFLNDPQLLFGYETEDINFSWMKNVTKEEAQNCLANWSHWAKTAKPDPNYKKAEHHVGEWVYTKAPNNDSNPFINRIPDGHGGYKTIENVSYIPEVVEYEEVEKSEVVEKNEEDEWFNSLTPSAKQSWYTATEFPCCPSEVSKNGLLEYKENLKEGKLFSKGVHDSFYSYNVIAREINEKKNMLVVLSRNEGEEHYMGTYALTCIKIEKDYYVHMAIKRFSTNEDATHFYRVLLGEEKLTEEDEIWLDT